MKKKLPIMICILVVALGLAIYCLSLWLPELTVTANTTESYNTAATSHALSGSYISGNEILLAQQVKKTDAQTEVTFRIFSLAEGLKAEDFLKLTADQAAGKPGLTEVGTASCQFIGDDTKNIRNFSVMHNI